jgi:hypothetical protein
LLPSPGCPWKPRSSFAAFDAHPEVAAVAAEARADPCRWHPAFWYFFITKRATASSSIPVACIQTNGLVRTPDGRTFNIPQVYRASGRSIWAPVTIVREHLERAGLIAEPPGAEA